MSNCRWYSPDAMSTVCSLGVTHNAGVRIKAINAITTETFLRVSELDKKTCTKLNSKSH